MGAIVISVLVSLIGLVVFVTNELLCGSVALEIALYTYAVSLMVVVLIYYVCLKLTDYYHKLIDQQIHLESLKYEETIIQVANQKSEELPLGLKQRLSMACALIHNPPVLFLDEPTSGVDVITRRDFWNHITSLAKKGVTILVTTHFMDEAEYCDRISLFYKGETIALGTPEELKQKAGTNTMEETFIRLIKESEAK